MPVTDVMPKSSPVVRGVANIRGATIPILDLAMATGLPGLKDKNSFVIITEYNTKTQGFLVRSVERIVNMNWEEIHPPPKGTGRDHYLTAVTRVDNQHGRNHRCGRCWRKWRRRPSRFRSVWSMPRYRQGVSLRVLTVDDSSVARKQVTPLPADGRRRSGGAQRWPSGAGLPAQAGR
jgi:two-component system chemotaxis response regulator CheV